MSGPVSTRAASVPRIAQNQLLGAGSRRVCSGGAAHRAPGPKHRRNLFARAPGAHHAAVARALVLCCEPHVSYTSTSDQIGGCSTRSVTTIGAAGKAAGGDAATIAAAAAARAPGGSEDGAVLKGGCTATLHIV